MNQDKVWHVSIACNMMRIILDGVILFFISSFMHAEMHSVCTAVPLHPLHLDAHFRHSKPSPKANMQVIKQCATSCRYDVQAWQVAERAQLQIADRKCSKQTVMAGGIITLLIRSIVQYTASVEYTHESWEFMSILWHHGWLPRSRGSLQQQIWLCRLQECLWKNTWIYSSSILHHQALISSYWRQNLILPRHQSGKAMRQKPPWTVQRLASTSATHMQIG